MRVNKPGISAGLEDTTVMFEGRPVAARRGESLAAALIASGHLAFRRTTRTGERGVFCGMGVCSECALQIGGVAGRLACMERVEPSLDLEPNPAARPVGNTPPLPGSSPVPEQVAPEEVRQSDLVVVGAGPAGLRASIAANRAGARVLVVDERAEAGGQYFKQPAAPLDIDEAGLDAQYRAGRALLREAETGGVEILHGARVWGHSGPHELYAASGTGRYLLRSRALVLATGAYERAVPFPGWTLPGVMTTGAAQTLLRSYLVAPGRRVLVAGNGPLNLQVAAELAAAGVRVVAVAEAAALFRADNARHLARMASAAPRYAREGFSYLRALARWRVPVLAPAAVIEVAGQGRARLATVAKLDDSGRPRPRSSQLFEVDAVCLGPGFVPSSELARSLGCEHQVDERTGTLVARRDHNGRTSVAGVWVAGDGGGIGGAQVAQAMGALAGFDAASYLGLPPAADTEEARLQAERELATSERFQESLWRLFAAPRLLDQLATPGTVICRCEEVTLADLTAAATPWLAAAGSLKRATRAGMGKCQGRYCGPVLVALAARQSGEPIGPYSGFAPQAPVTPATVAALAGEPPAGVGCEWS